MIQPARRIPGKRHTTSDEDVQRVMERIEELVPRDALEQLSERTIPTIRHKDLAQMVRTMGKQIGSSYGAPYVETFHLMVNQGV